MVVRETGSIEALRPLSDWAVITFGRWTPLSLNCRHLCSMLPFYSSCYRNWRVRK